MTELDDRVAAWRADEVSDRDATELDALVAAGDTAALTDRFSATLAFGTAGLRGPLRAGPNGMNAAVVRRAAAGIAAWLGSRDAYGSTVVIGHDARHRSREFAHDSAGVFAAAGFEVEVLPGPLPTPVLAYAVRDRDAAVGIMVTASHNPANDNGYKVYLGLDPRLHASPEDSVLGDGAQIVPPVDSEIEASIAAVGPTAAIALSDDWSTLGDDLVEGYVRAVVGASGVESNDPANAALRIVHTSMHGVGWTTVQRVFDAAGFTSLVPVTQQRDPDPEFPTVAFPNPEEAGALDLALALAAEQDAQLLIANDPDADRCALAVPGSDGTWRALTGDEVGVLLADALLRDGVTGTYATTIVSSTMLGALVEAAGPGAVYAETLTGFKWIVRGGADLAFGYEEALGYAVAPSVVRDKDGISAGLLAAVLTRDLLAAGSSPAARLDELAAQFGVHLTRGVSLRVDDLAAIGTMLDALRADPPATLGGHEVSTVDLRDQSPATDGARLTWETGRAVVRPSGTEPKLKVYLEVRRSVASGEVADVATARTEAAAELDAIAAELTSRLRAAAS
ncbi:phospho-sugar mutase [Jatrophihabitans sp. YIM 134969]